MRYHQVQETIINHRKEELLNVAAFIPESRTLGPGLRAVIWVQGCPFSCQGCIAPEWIPMKKANYVYVDQIVKEILKSKLITGLTISGGEPMLQATPLTNLLNKLRNLRELDVVCFTGFKYEDLLKLPSGSEERKLLGLVDVLVDGPYIAKLNDNQGLRGSSNQRIINLTDRLSSFDLENMPRQIEVRISNQSMMVVGVPSIEVLNALNNSFFLLQNSPGG